MSIAWALMGASLTCAIPPLTPFSTAPSTRGVLFVESDDMEETVEKKLNDWKVNSIRNVPRSGMAAPGWRVYLIERR